MSNFGSVDMACVKDTTRCCSDDADCCQATAKLAPLILWGGVDISSHWYNEPPHPKTQAPNISRDEEEFAAVQQAVDQGRSAIGICRGAQLLCVFNKGKLHQHVPQHQNNSHPIMTKDDKIIYGVAADHHQVMILKGEHIVYATAYDQTEYERHEFGDVAEVVWWPETRCLAIQPHPEWMPSSHPFNLWLNDLMKQLDINWEF